MEDFYIKRYRERLDQMDLDHAVGYRIRYTVALIGIIPLFTWFMWDQRNISIFIRGLFFYVFTIYCVIGVNRIIHFRKEI